MNMEEVSVVDFSDTPIDTTIYPKDYKDMLLTTLDNPYSPFNDFTRWNDYDERLGYYTNKLLARLVGAPSKFIDTGLGKEIESKFYYSTMLDIIHKSIHIPYVAVSETDYTSEGVLKLLNPSVFNEINTLTA